MPVGARCPTSSKDRRVALELEPLAGLFAELTGQQHAQIEVRAQVAEQRSSLPIMCWRATAVCSA